MQPVDKMNAFTQVQKIIHQKTKDQTNLVRTEQLYMIPAHTMRFRYILLGATIMNILVRINLQPS
jgi:hypothetical protein